MSLCEIEMGLSGPLDPESGMCASLPDLEHQVKKISSLMQNAQLNSVFSVTPLSLDVCCGKILSICPDISFLRLSVQNQKNNQKFQIEWAEKADSIFTMSLPWAFKLGTGGVAVNLEFTRKREWNFIETESIKEKINPLKAVQFMGEFYPQAFAFTEALWDLVTPTKDLEKISFVSAQPFFRIEKNK